MAAARGCGPAAGANGPSRFLPLLGTRTLFEQALDRCDAPGFAAPVIVTGDAYVPLVREQGRAGMTIIVEPAAKNTAPAIALAAARLPEDAIMLVCPSDHHIADEDAFRAAARAGAKLAADGRLVAFGIAPTRPETGYGYIERGKALDGGFEVARFVEKPDADTAQGYLDTGRFDWNGGIFVFRAGTLLAELARHRPALADAVRRSVAEGREDGDRFDPAADAFARIEGDSIDYAVMEPTTRAAMVPVDMGWSDIGSWESLRDASPRDAEGHVRRGRSEIVACRNVMVDSDGPRVSVIGLEDVIVVVHQGEVLVAHASAAQRVGKLQGVKE